MRFDVAAHFRPGCPWWMFLVWFFGVVFYAFNVINSLGTFLAIAGVLSNTWVLIILADYFICRRWLRLGRTADVEFREHEVRAWNPAGLISLGLAVAVGALGIVGIYPISYASFPRWSSAHYSTLPSRSQPKDASTPLRKAPPRKAPESTGKHRNVSLS